MSNALQGDVPEPATAQREETEVQADEDGQAAAAQAEAPTGPDEPAATAHATDQASAAQTVPDTADADAVQAPAYTPEALRALADELGAPFASALGSSLRQAQAHIGTLRWEIAHEIRALGPVADRLERMDAALTRAMQAKMGELLDRMEYAARLTFERACQHALHELPEDFGEEDLAEWSRESGWIGRYRERCVRMTKALFGHLRRGLEGLLRSATHPGISVDSTQGENA